VQLQTSNLQGKVYETRYITCELLTVHTTQKTEHAFRIVSVVDMIFYYEISKYFCKAFDV
jgi:hypothetical protein